MSIKNRKSYVLNFALILALLSGLFGVIQVHAATLTVTNINDSGAGSLRQMIINASSGDTITFDASLAGQTITLASNLVINKDLIIDGSGLSPQITINGGNAYHLAVSGLTVVTISDLTITNGYASGNGGGIYSIGDLTLINSTLENNYAVGDGGAIYANNLTMKNTTIYRNQTEGDGGALALEGNTYFTIVNSTISQNQAGGHGGGIFIQGNIDGEISNNTFASNSAAEGIELAVMGNGGINLYNTILVCTSGDGNCIFQSGFPPLINNVNSIVGVGTLSDFGLAELADNGGPTQTMALLPGSPLIDAGDDTICANTPVNNLDQRGIVRPQGTHCDIGAYEDQFIVRYVKQDATGASDGSSWTNAHTDLQSALVAASPDEEIWIAAGTYKPTSTTDRTISFNLKNGVAVYGGFAGAETSRDQRDYEANPTILSGDIGAVGDNSDNSYHVVVGSNTNNSAMLDGFTVTAGNANLGQLDTGGGMLNQSGSPTVANVTFSGNSAGLGGGMYNGGDYGFPIPNGSSPILTNVTFSNNSAQEGGGMENQFYSSPTLTNVSFINNTAIRSGGGMINYDHSSPTLTNVTFSGNTASVGGGIMNWSSSSPTLTNVTFNANSATDWGGGMYNDNGSNPGVKNVTFNNNQASEGGGMYNAYISDPTITNSILYGNTGGEIYNVSGTADVTYSIVQGGYAGIGNLDADPLLGPLADNGGFTQTMALGAGSPAIDAGDDTNCPATDQRGVSRPQGAACDIGAYEYEPTIANVDVAISGNNVGNYDVGPEESVSDNYGINSGPVRVSSTNSLPIFASQRAIFGSSFNSIVGYPANQLTTDYWFTSYDDLGMITYLVIGNPHPTLTAQVDVYIGGIKRNTVPYSIAPGQRIFPRYGINGGPVHVVSTNGVDIFTSERSKFGNSFNEVMGYPGNQVTTDYWFTSYDDVGMLTYLVIGNPHATLTAEVDVYIAGVKKNIVPYVIAPGQRIFPRYAINGGPVRVVSTNGVDIFTSERSKFGQSFNEVLGYPADQLSTDYWFTSYDDASMITYLVIGNPHPTLTAEVDVYINGVKKNATPYVIAPGQRVFPRYGIDQGPVEVISTNGVNIFTSERSKYLSSFNEILGISNDQLTTDYWFTSYDDLGMSTFLVIGAP